MFQLSGLHCGGGGVDVFIGLLRDPCISAIPI